MKVAWDLELAELNRITELWADSALQLREQDLKVMGRLVAAQARLARAAGRMAAVAVAVSAPAVAGGPLAHLGVAGVLVVDHRAGAC